jgi:hypothetical protein
MHRRCRTRSGEVPGDSPVDARSNGADGDGRRAVPRHWPGLECRYSENAGPAEPTRRLIVRSRPKSRSRSSSDSSQESIQETARAPADSSPFGEFTVGHKRRSRTYWERTNRTNPTFNPQVPGSSPGRPTDGGEGDRCLRVGTLGDRGASADELRVVFGARRGRHGRNRAVPRVAREGPGRRRAHDRGVGDGARNVLVALRALRAGGSGCARCAGCTRRSVLGEEVPTEEVIHDGDVARSVACDDVPLVVLRPGIRRAAPLRALPAECRLA